MKYREVTMGLKIFGYSKINGIDIGQKTPAKGAFTELKASTNPVDEHGVGDRGFNDARYTPKDLDATTVTNPALNAAVTTDIVNVYGGVIITLTGAGNSQTLGTPTDATVIKRFIVVIKGAFNIQVNGITMTGGEAQWFIWDGASWVAVTAVDADDITFTPAGNIVATNVQTAIAEVDTEKMKRISSTDNEVARFDSTGGDVQGYSSNPPTIDDNGLAAFPGGLTANFDEIIQATSDTLTIAELRGQQISNYGQGASDNLQTLPTAAEGMSFVAMCGTAQGANYYGFQADTSDKFYLDGVAGSDNGIVKIAAPVVGACIYFYTFKTGATTWDWAAITIIGDWVAA